MQKHYFFASLRKVEFLSNKVSTIPIQELYCVDDGKAFIVAPAL
jgi:hypothetical protein